MVEVLGIRGPAIYQRIEVSEGNVAAAIGPNGWAMLPVPGALIEYEPSAPLRADWVVPGYVIPPELVPPAPPDPPEVEPPR